MNIELWGERLTRKRVGVIGDFCLDRNNVHGFTGLESLEFKGIPINYVINPETEYAPGGAGNVAINFRKLGVDVIPFGIRGMDFSSLYLMQLFGEQGIQTFGLIPDMMRRTPRYEKFYKNENGNLVQIDRLDTYNTSEISRGMQKRFLEVLQEELKHTYFSGFYIADQIPTKYYPCITSEMRQSLEQILSKAGIPVMVDSRERIREWKNGRFILKPNQKEVWRDYGNTEETIMKYIFKDKEMRYLFEGEMRNFLYSINVPFMYVTLHEKGAVLFQRSHNPIYIPTLPVKNGDPTGCGDALGVAAFTALVVGETPLEAAKFGNAAAYYTIQQIGKCGMPTLEELFKNYKTLYGK